jgi:ankyrin
VVLLLQHGANADATTKDKYTPLHIAAKEGHDEVAQVLLENGASHSVTTKVRYLKIIFVLFVCLFVY